MEQEKGNLKGSQKTQIHLKNKTAVKTENEGVSYARGMPK